MFSWLNRLHRLKSTIQKKFHDDPAVEVQLLPENQLLITKELILNHTSRPLGKAESRVPAETGFRVYLAVRSPETHAEERSRSQRIGLNRPPPRWDAHTMALRVDPDVLDAEWTFLNQRGQVVFIHATCGSAQVVAQVNQVLQEIQTQCS